MCKRFIETTHEVYKEHCEEDFGGTVPSIFTDEPQYAPLSTLNKADGLQDIFIPWTRGIEGTYEARWGEDLVGRLPEVVWDVEEGKSNLTRYQFLDHLCDLFSTNYIGGLAEWCGKNGLMCTGHMNAVSRRR